MDYSCYRLNAALWERVEPFATALGFKVSKNQMKYGLADAVCAMAEEGETLVGILLGSYFESHNVAQIFVAAVGWPWRDKGIEDVLYKLFVEKIGERWYCDQVHFLYNPGDEMMLGLLCRLKPDESDRLKSLNHSSIIPVEINNDATSSRRK